MLRLDGFLEASWPIDPHVARMPHLAAPATPAPKKFDPIRISLLSLQAIVFVAQHLAKLLQQTLRLGGIYDRVHKITKSCIYVRYLA